MAAGDVTVLLRRMAQETGPARRATYDQVVGLVYDELRRRARAQLRNERADSLQPTILVHAAYERLMKDRMSYQDRLHFYRMAGVAMRRFLVDRARRLSAARRGARQVPTTVTNHTPAAAANADPDLVLAVERAMDALTEEQVQLTELRYFVGLTIEETAGVMGLNVETAKKRWRVIKTLLIAELGEWAPDGR